MSESSRNHTLDAARAFAVFVVVVFHSLLYEVHLSPAGWPDLVPWAPPHWPWWFLSWFFMVIPLFFAAGGFGHAHLVDRLRGEGVGYAGFLANRGSRLLGPLVLFVTLSALVSSLAGLLWQVDAASALSRQIMQLLWFIAVYLVIVAAAPLLVSVYDRWGWTPTVALAAAAALVDAWSFRIGDPMVRNANLLLVWPAVHQVGVAYHRGWFRTRTRSTGALFVGAAGIAILTLALGYPGSSVGLADIPFANVQPPTVAMVLLGLAQCGLLGLIERSRLRPRPGPRLKGVLALVNSLMMSVYLWHIGCIALAATSLALVARAAPGASMILLAQPTVAAVTLALVAVIVPHIGRLELRLIPPLGDRPDGVALAFAYALLVVGVTLVWQAGTVINLARPWSSAGVLLVWIGSALMRRASTRGRR